MKIFIKYMVSNRCKMAVKEALRVLDLHFVVVDLGEVDIMEDLTKEQLELLRIALNELGLELMGDKKAILIDKIKTIVVEMIHQEDDQIKMKFSQFLSSKLHHDYSYLSNLFSEVQGITIEQFMIAHKVQYIKELITYNELNLTEIAWKMNYSSVAHLSNQFKKVTGFTPSHFKLLKDRNDNIL